MAEVTGPISTLPGACYAVPDGTMCDDHPDRPAVRRLQGETDSFGSEMHDLCAECAAEFKAYPGDDPEPHPCDWCKGPSTDRRAQRDSDEGLCGPVYYVCKACRETYRAKFEAEAEEYDRDHGIDPWDDHGGDDRDALDDYPPTNDVEVLSPLPPLAVAVAVENEVRILTVQATIGCRFCGTDWTTGHTCSGLRNARNLRSRQQRIRHLAAAGKPT